MKTLRNNKSYKSSRNGFLLILFSLLMIGGSTFAFFTYRLRGDSTLNFGKIQVSDTDSHIKLTKTIDNLVPGDNLLNESETIKYTVDSGSENLYSRVRFYFSTDSTEAVVKGYVDSLNLLSVNDWNLVKVTGYTWVKGDNNYYYYVTDDDNDNLVKELTKNEVVTFANKLVVPTTLA